MLRWCSIICYFLITISPMAFPWSINSVSTRSQPISLFSQYSPSNKIIYTRKMADHFISQYPKDVIFMTQRLWLFGNDLFYLNCKTCFSKRFATSFSGRHLPKASSSRSWFCIADSKSAFEILPSLSPSYKQIFTIQCHMITRAPQNVNVPAVLDLWVPRFRPYTIRPIVNADILVFVQGHAW